MSSMAIDVDEDPEFSWRSERRRSPEHRLMLAVLQDAVSIFQRGLWATAVEEREKFREVDAWMKSRDHDWPFSYECICSTLRIDADYLRAGLRGLRRRVMLERNRPGMVVPELLTPPRERIRSRRAWRGRVG